MNQHKADLDPITRSRRILAVYWALLALGSHLPQLKVGNESNQIGVFQVDKTLHLIAFSGLAWLLYKSRLAGRRATSYHSALSAAVIAIIYAMIDEYTQKWTGRDVSYSDVVAGVIGIIGVFLILAAPPPRSKAGRLTKTIRILAVIASLIILVFALAPEGNQWFGRLARPLFQPWPDFDKAGHFYVSAGLMLMLAFSWIAGVHRPRLSLFLSILVIGLAGPIIETAQMYTGRGVEMRDLYAHQLGLLAAMTALAVLTVFRQIGRRTDR